MQRPLVPPLPPVPPRSRQNSSIYEAPLLPHRRDRHAHATGSRKSSTSLPSNREGGRIVMGQVPNQARPAAMKTKTRRQMSLT